MRASLPPSSLLSERFLHRKFMLIMSEERVVYEWLMMG
jgi:hypothetical protein